MNEKSLLSRGFAILGAFSGDGRRLTLADLVERTGLPKATTHRLCSQMVELGVLQRDGGWYHLGVRLMELAGLVPLQRDLRERAIPYMQDLYLATRETIHLGILDGTSVVYIDRISGHRRANVPTRVGGRMPAYCTGLGKALLAFAPEPLVERALCAPLAPLTAQTITIPSVLRSELEKARATGVAFDREETCIGVSCVAAAVPNEGGGAVAAISVTGSAERVTGKFASTVRNVALALSEHLQHHKRPSGIFAAV